MRTDDEPAGAASPDDLPTPFAELGPEGRVLSSNQALRELIGYGGEGGQAIPPLPDLIPREWLPGAAGVAETEKTKQFATGLTARDGSRVPVEAFVRRINDREGNPDRFIVVLAPVAGLIEAGIIRAEQQATLALSVLDSIEAPMFATDDQSRIVYANRYTRRLFNKPAQDIVGANVWNAYSISHYDLFYRIYQRAFQEHRILSCDHYAQRLNRWFEAHFYPREGGGLVVTMNNVTTRKQYERFMGMAAYAIERVSDYVIWVDARGLITKANNVADRDLQIAAERKARVSISDVSDITPEKWVELWGKIKKKVPVSLEARLYRPGREPIPVEASVSFISYVGQELGVLIARDITDRLRAEREIGRSREQAELYLDLMSHDIRNINQIGAGFIELALGSADLREDEKELLEKPLEAFQRSTDLIANVKKLQRSSGTLTLEKTALASMLREVATQYADVKGRDVSIELEAGEHCCVRANPLLREVFANIVGNAIKHSTGRIDIRITLKKITVAGKSRCEVTVEDDGPGIPDELKPRLFSVKKLAEKGGRRRGLGLILAKSLLDDFGGAIRVEDRAPGDYSKGARFVVTLPAVD